MAMKSNRIPCRAFRTALLGCALLVCFAICAASADAQDYEWQLLTTEDGLISNSTHAVFAASDGSVWIGSYDDGVNQYKDGALSSWPDMGLDDVPTSVRRSL